MGRCQVASFGAVLRPSQGPKRRWKADATGPWVNHGPGPGPLVGRLGHHSHAHSRIATIVSNQWDGLAGWLVACVNLKRPNKGRKERTQSRATFDPCGIPPPPGPPPHRQRDILLYVYVATGMLVSVGGWLGWWALILGVTRVDGCLGRKNRGRARGGGVLLDIASPADVRDPPKGPRFPLTRASNKTWGMPCCGCWMGSCKE